MRTLASRWSVLTLAAITAAALLGSTINDDDRGHRDRGRGRGARVPRGALPAVRGALQHASHALRAGSRGASPRGARAPGRGCTPGRTPSTSRNTPAGCRRDIRDNATAMYGRARGEHAGTTARPLQHAVPVAR